MKVYGYSVGMSVTGCNPQTFTRDSIREFFRVLCKAIDMEPEDLHFWDYEGDKSGYEQAPAHLRGISAVQFIKTSTIIVHALDELQAVFIDLFSCKEFDYEVVEDLIAQHFQGEIVAVDTFERPY